VSDSQNTQALAAQAHEVQRQIIGLRREAQLIGIKLATLLYAAEEERAWELLGHESMRAWLDSPEIDISYSHAKGLTKAYREIVVERQIEPTQLDGVDLRKLQMAMKSVRDGEVSMDDAISDAQSLGREDMRIKYGGDPNRGIDPGGDDGPKVECQTCGSFVDPDRIKDAA
jgi:hypothetical protein